MGTDACRQWVFWTVGSTTQHDWFRQIRSSHWIAGGSHERIAITEIDGQVVAVAVRAPAAAFDKWLGAVQPLLDSITFEVPADGA